MADETLPFCLALSPNLIRSSTPYCHHTSILGFAIMMGTILTPIGLPGFENFWNIMCAVEQ